MTQRCQLLPSCTTLPSAHNRLQTKRKCAACCMCGQQFSHGEARLQQWSNRNSQRAYVHAPCVNGGVAQDHELHPKQPTDQDAVEAVSRQRDCVTQAAADSEILLPLTASSDQASTAAPTDDEQSMCGRVEALRFGRRDHELSNGLTQSRGAPSRTFEAPRTFAHRRDSDLHSNKLSMPSSVPSHITGHHHQLRSHPGKSSCSAVGFS